MTDLKQIADKTIKKGRGNFTLVKPFYDTQDIIELIKHVHPKGAGDTANFAKHIPGETKAEYCKNLYEFVKQNIAYKLDPEGRQFIKTPAQTWKDKECDCKGYSLFLASCLQNKNIPYKYRFVSFSGSPVVTHVYIIVPLGNVDYITLDCVLPNYNQEKPFTFKKDITMKPGLYSVSGPKLIDLGDKPIDQITDGEMDLLIARDRLQTEKEIVENIRGIGSLTAEKYQDSIDMLNDAIEAIHGYEIGAIEDLDDEMDLILYDALNGAYSIAHKVSGIGRIGAQKYRENARLKRLAARNVTGIGRIKLLKKAKAAVKKATSKTKKLVKKAAAKVRKVIPKPILKAGKAVKKVVKKVVKTAAKVVTAPARLLAKGILEVTLPKSAPNFLYLFINDKALLEKSPAKVRTKRAKAEKMANFIVNGIGMKRDHFMGIVRNGIMKEYGKSPEKVIDEQMKGKISGIGVAAIVTTALAALKKVIQAIAKLIKKKAPSFSKSDAPDPTDWLGLNTQQKTTLAKEIKSQPENITVMPEANEIITDNPTETSDFQSGGRSIWNSLK